jgi:hypothetical protein
LEGTAAGSDVAVIKGSITVSLCRRLAMNLNCASTVPPASVARRLLLSGLSLGLAACSSVPQNEGAPASIGEVVYQIKDDLHRYAAYNSKHVHDVPKNDHCGGVIGFDVANVKVSMTTSIDRTAGASASATLPVGSATFGPSFSTSFEGKNTQALTFTLYPKDDGKTDDVTDPDTIDPAKWPIASNLKSLREGLLEGSYKEPCYALAPAAGADAGDTFVFGFTVTKQTQDGATLKFLVFSLGATNSVQRQAGNTITVTFKARPGSVGLQQQ